MQTRFFCAYIINWCAPRSHPITIADYIDYSAYFIDYKAK